ncbi:MAG: DEAD/DEAH box helicase [Victivallales bacterium]|nr:DEAD/DEAH box helicase [Victivallales bacterium]
MNTENNQQSPQDDGILSFDDAISPKDSEKQQENNTEEKAAGTTENPSAEETSEHQPEMSDNETADEAVQQEDNLESVAEEEPVITFDSFGFCPEIMQALNEAGFREPTPIQVKAIPSVMEGRDVIGQALTGTGKTAAFGLPTMQKIMNEPGLNLLVLVPTRELAAQVSNELFKLGRYANIHTAAFTGGQSYSRQETMLAKGINALVATPGRLLDLIDSGHFDDINPKHIVVDEADEMLDMGFLDDVKKIFEHFDGDHQTMLFSATMPRPVIQLAEHILKDPVNITTSITESTNNDIEQLFYVIEDHERADAVIRLIDAENVTKGMIFCRTKEETDSLNILLSARGYNVNCLHGDMEQAQRSRVMAAFRRGEIDILVATDVAARGLDVDDVSHVFNYHLPFDSRGYVHRIGRTGRAGKSGTAITLVTPREMRQLDAIRRNVGAQLQNRLVPTRTQVTEQRLKKIFHDVHDYKLDMNILNQVETLSVNQDLLVIIAKLLAHQLESCGDKGPEEIGLHGPKLQRVLDRSDRKGRERREGGRDDDRDGRGGRRRRDRGDRDDRDERGSRRDRGERRGRREYDAWAKEEDFGENEAPVRQRPGNLDRPSYAENAPNMREEQPAPQEKPARTEQFEHTEHIERQDIPEERPAIVEKMEPAVREEKPERAPRDERPKRRFDDERPRFDDERPRYSDERPKRRFDDERPRYSDERPKRRFDDERPRYADERPKRRFDDERPKRRFDDERPRFDDERPKRRFDDERPRFARDGKVNLRESDTHAPRKGKWADKFQDSGSKKKFGGDRNVSFKTSFSSHDAPQDKKKSKRNLPPPPPQISKRSTSSSKGQNWYFN